MIIRRSLSTTMALCKRRLNPAQMPSLLDIGSRNIFDADHDIFRESVRNFMKHELVPIYESEILKAGKPTREIWKKFGNQGLLGVSVPEKAGGVGGTFKDEAIILEEMGYVNVSSPSVAVQSTIVMPYLEEYGTQEQIDAHLKPMIAGDKVGAIAMTEPDAGSDLQGIKTIAKRNGDDYIINGSKSLITNGILADTVIVVAITKPEAKSRAHGITLFLVDGDAKGFKRGRNLHKIGCHGQDTAELFFEDVRVPSSSILGREHEGFYHLMTQLSQERVAIAVGATAHCEWMFEETRNYIRERKAFGSTLSSLPTIKHKMAELKSEIVSCRAFIDECIQQQADKTLDHEMACMAKYHSTELINKVATECLQMHGGWGYMYETPIARAFIDARVHSIYAGANEVMKEIISRNIIKTK